MNTLLNRLLLWHKFALLGLLGAISVAVPLTLFILESNKAVHSAQEQARAIVPIQSLFKVVQMIQQHRGLSAMVLNGNEDAKALRSKKQSDVNAAMTGMETTLQALGEKDLNDRVAALKNEWAALSDKLDHLTITGKESFTEHTTLVMHFLKLSDVLIDRYGLSVNSDFDTRNLIESTLIQSPVLTEELGRLRAKGSGLLAAKTASADDRLDLRGRIDKINALYAKTSESLTKALDVNADLKGALSDLARGSFETGEQTLQMAQKNIVKPEELTLASATFFDQVTQAINVQLKLNDQSLSRLDAALNNRVAVLKTTLYELIVALVTLLCVIAWFGYRITVSVTAPLHQAVYFAEKIAQGDLTGRIVSSSQNETGQLLQALGMMNDGLVKIVSKVRNVTDSIASASSQIAAGNLDLSSRTEEEASALEETAATMEQLTATVKNNLSEVGTATQLAASASAVAVKGGEMIARVVRTMDDINSSSRQIFDIIGLIDSIAFLDQYSCIECGR